MSIIKSASKRSFALAGLAKKIITKEVTSYVSGKERLVTRLKQAQDLVDGLSRLKGTAMKMGQLLALESREFLPQEVVAVLEQLQNQATFMNQAESIALLRSGLGDKFSTLKNISETPIAAASIGQVHSAFVGDKKVAVKIQYPGISETIDSDIKILKSLTFLISKVVGKSKVDYSDLFEEMTQSIKNETRYLEEARATIKYKDLAKVMRSIRVPTVYQELTTETILTLSFEAGTSLSQALKMSEFDYDKRLHFGKLFLEVYTRELCQWGFVQTDPNLGNFLVDLKTNELVLLDFGATKNFSETFRKNYSTLILSGLEMNRKQILKNSLEFGIIDPRETEEVQNCFLDLIITSMEPFRVPEFDFSTFDYSQKTRSLGKTLVEKVRFSPPPKDLLFLHRKLGGIFQILRRLEVKLDLRSYIEPHRQIVEGREISL
jgi:predicted unusual protein kinase regulating ubiquinone biosynthesis (AarF/ABC1/UbiB family)